MLVGLHSVHTECRQVAQGLRPSSNLCDGLRPCFEALGRRHEGRFLHGDPLDHGTAGKHWRHSSEQRTASPQCTGTRGAQHLVG